MNVYIGFSKREECYRLLNLTLDKIKSSNKELLVLGDFNHNFIETDTNNSVRDLVTDFGTRGLQPLISAPTRIELKGGGFIPPPV